MPGYAGASDVEKLRSASVWLKDNNPYYHNVEWREGWAEECLKNDKKFVVKVPLSIGCTATPFKCSRTT